jgi:hypothetical protein
MNRCNCEDCLGSRPYIERFLLPDELIKRTASNRRLGRLVLALSEGPITAHQIFLITGYKNPKSAIKRLRALGWNIFEIPPFTYLRKDKLCYEVRYELSMFQIYSALKLIEHSDDLY